MVAVGTNESDIDIPIVNGAPLGKVGGFMVLSGHV
jgi:hypothetical protein